MGKPGVAGVYMNQRLNLSKPWEGPRRTCQGLELGSGNPTVQDFRGASGTVRHGENVTPSCNRKSGNGNPSPTARRARFLSQQQARAHGVPPGYGVQHPSTDSRNNVGKLPGAAGTGDNLQGLSKRG